jgi:hypothetical protein
LAAGGRAVNRAAYLVEGGDVHASGTLVKSKHMAVREGGDIVFLNSVNLSKIIGTSHGIPAPCSSVT